MCMLCSLKADKIHELELQLAQLKRSTTLKWLKHPPNVHDMKGSGEEFYWARGGNFNRDIMVKVTNGVSSIKTEAQRLFSPECNYTFMAENYPPHIWGKDLPNWPGLSNLEWAGPVQRPPEEVCPKQ